MQASLSLLSSVKPAASALTYLHLKIAVEVGLHLSPKPQLLIVSSLFGPARAGLGARKPHRFPLKSSTPTFSPKHLDFHFLAPSRKINLLMSQKPDPSGKSGKWNPSTVSFVSTCVATIYFKRAYGDGLTQLVLHKLAPKEPKGKLDRDGTQFNQTSRSRALYDVSL